MARIAWLVPSLISGSGGHRTILAYAKALELAGHQCLLYLENAPPLGLSPFAHVKQLFGYSFDRIIIGWNSLKPADAFVATIWYSADIVARLPFDCQRFYLVQDWEALFNPVGDTYIFAENSYLLGLKHITVGSWLAHELKNRFNVDASAVQFGADSRNYFRSNPQPISTKSSVCFIYQPDKPRRCAQLGLEALRLLKTSFPEVELHLYGSQYKPDSSYKTDYFHHGLLDLKGCNTLYNQCQVGLCLSASNPSRIPFEMMAAGLPVVELWRANNLYDLPQEAVLLSEQTPLSIAGSLLKLLNDPQGMRQMSDAGVAFMSERDQLQEGLMFVRAIECGLSKRGAIQESSLNMIYCRLPHRQFPSDLARIQIPAHSTLSRRSQILRRLPLWLQPVAKNLARKLIAVRANLR